MRKDVTGDHDVDIGSRANHAAREVSRVLGTPLPADSDDLSDRTWRNAHSTGVIQL
jgi:hypothetical protein